MLHGTQEWRSEEGDHTAQVGCSSESPRSDSQPSHSGSNRLTPASDLTPSFDRHGHQACMWYADIDAGRTLAHIWKQTSRESEVCGSTAQNRPHCMGFLSRPPVGEGKKLTPYMCALAHRCPQNHTQNKQINAKILRTRGSKVDHMASHERWYTHPGQAQQCSGSTKLQSIYLEDKHVSLKQEPLERIHNLGISNAQSKCWPSMCKTPGLNPQCHINWVCGVQHSRGPGRKI